MYVRWKRRRRGNYVLLCCYLVTARRHDRKIRHDVIAYLAGVSEDAVARLKSSSSDEQIDAAERLFLFWRRVERVFSARLRVQIAWRKLRMAIERKVTFIDEQGIRAARRIAHRKECGDKSGKSDRTEFA
jgi:predicted transcriptional regulator